MKSIDELNELITLAFDDVLTVVDVSDTLSVEQSKKITVLTLLTFIQQNLDLEMGIDFTVTNVTQGSYVSGDQVQATDSIPEVIRRMLVKAIPASYTAPQLQFTSDVSSGQSYAPNTQLAPVNFTATFTKNDAGPINSFEILDEDGLVVASTTVDAGTTTVLTYQDNDLLLDSQKQYRATVSYDQGPVKNDSSGNPSPNGRIPASSISRTITYSIASEFLAGYSLAPGEIPNSVTGSGGESYVLNTLQQASNGGVRRTVNLGGEEIVRYPNGNGFAVAIFVPSNRSLTSFKFGTDSAESRSSVVQGTNVTIENNIYKFYYLAPPGFIPQFAGDGTSDPEFQVRIQIS